MGRGGPTHEQRPDDHPVRRWCARLVDMLCFAPAALAGYMVSVAPAMWLATRNPGPPNTALLDFALAGVWAAAIVSVALVEAAFISGLGTTPGKWIFGVQVRGAEGGKLPFRLSLKRAAIVYTLGMGLCIPVVAPATWAVFAWRLRKTGSTPWDNAAGCVVEHEFWKWPQAILCWLIGVIAISVHVAILSFFWMARHL